MHGYSSKYDYVQTYGATSYYLLCLKRSFLVYAQIKESKVEIIRSISIAPMLDIVFYDLFG